MEKHSSASLRLPLPEEGQGTGLDLLAEARRARQGAELASARMRSLQSLTLALSGALTPEDVARAVVVEAARTMEAHIGVLYLLDAAGTWLELMHAVRCPPEVEALVRRLPLEANLPVAEAVRTRAPLWLESYERMTERFPPASILTRPAHGNMSLACLPLHARGRTVGALGFTWERSRDFDTEERAFMDMMAQQASMALERARLLSAERRQVERTELLQRATAMLATSLDLGPTLRGVALGLVPTLGDFCIIDVMGPDREVRRTFHASTPECAALLAASRWQPSERPGTQVCALASGRPQFHPQVNAAWVEGTACGPEQLTLLRALAPCSWLSVPLETPEGLLGALTLGHSLSGQHHTPEDLALATELARRASAAVQNAHLFHQTQQALQLRDEFLAIASHELNTPLTALKLQLSRLRRMSSDVDMQERTLSAVQQVDRLGRLVRELLEVANLSEGRLHLAPEPMDLVGVCRDVLERFADEQSRAGTTVYLHASDAVMGRWDHSRVDGMVTHLVSNALKYGQGRPVDVEVRGIPGDLARLVVRDRGIGIPPEQLAHLFQRFGRAVPLRHYGGFGLGLWFSRQVVEAHGGHIHLESAPGQGTTVTVELPRTPESPDDAYP
ncbi:GAF domain-containing protein [Myxococcus sp. K15C18031901]|uniref:sensor histidine kinase n=1 Tax=Myxococcus dinghuensis TaxID=2906761 RepID=UPI0020A7E772|nr:ATP-binding protein [Myxococcus dinghuensis]MCP3104136.1 GAF domain-containing protein [Myxococcus dinghuensis]